MFAPRHCEQHIARDTVDHGYLADAVEIIRLLRDVVTHAIRLSASVQPRRAEEL